MAREPSGRPLSYAGAGVDIDAGNALVERIRDVARRTSRPEVLGGLGGFAALCRLPTGMREPILVAGTDGVGTKLRLAMQLGIHDTIGIDLVAMCVNDLVVCGAEPLFFLDYYATGHLDVDTAAAVVGGIGRGCEAAGCALIGGETAEMPGMYEGEDYDLAGFCVGVVERDGIIDGSAVKPGDRLIALASSGPHSNGYSLIRKIIELDGTDLTATVDGRTLGELLLEPTRIYVKNVLAAVRAGGVNAVAHITGGGLFENIPRVLPDGAKAVVDLGSWRRPAVFDWLSEHGNVAEREMYRTFNCGVGMVMAVAAERAEAVLQSLTENGENAWIVGEIIAHVGSEEAVELTGQHP